MLSIDCTGSMGDLLDTVKTNALKFYPDLKARCDAKGKDISELRIRVIGFRDFDADGENTIQDSGFFNIPDQESEFKSFVNALQPKGGCSFLKRTDMSQSQINARLSKWLRVWFFHW